MLHKLLVFVFALGALNATANTVTAVDPIEDYLTLEIEKLELENELFGFMANDDDIVSIASIAVYDLNEKLELDINTEQYLPAGFDAKKGMNEIDWNTIELYEMEEEVDLNFNTKAQLPNNFIHAKKLACDTVTAVDHNNQ